MIKDMELVKILWNYMRMNQKLRDADCIIALGTTDTNVANIASDLYLNGYSDKIIFSGGLGKDTYNLWNKTEAEKFAEIAMQRGVPRNAIYLEKESTNTGDNFKFSRKIIQQNKLDISSFIVVCKPYGERRAYAAFKKVMPEYDVIIHSENISCEEYYERNGREWIDVLVGDIQRMKLFFEKGWQVRTDVPQNVWRAYQLLVNRGFNKYVLKSIADEGNRESIEAKLNNVNKRDEKENQR